MGTMRTFPLSFLVLALFLPNSARTEPRTVTVNNLPVFAEPNSKSEVLLRLQKNQMVDRLETRGPWSRIRVNFGGMKFEAWVPTKALISGQKENIQDQKTIFTPKRTRKAIEARVVYVTIHEAYIDVGSLDGVVTGVELRALSGRAAPAPCRVSQVSDRSAMCVGFLPRVGDRLQGWGEVPIPETVERSTTLPIESSEEIRRRNQISSAVFQKITYVHREVLAGKFVPIPVSGSVGHDTWYSTGSTSYQREQANISVFSASLGKGWDASVDLSTWFWSQRPDTRRFRPGDSVQLYLWQALVEHRPTTDPFRVAAGRMRPYALPGIVMFDGIQSGYRIHRGAEVGIYGGLLPDITTLYPQKNPWLAGAYYQQDIVMTKDLLVKEDFRVGLAKSDDFGNRVELQTLWTASWKRWVDFGVDAKAGLTGGDLGGPTFDALRVDIGFRPIDPLRILLDGRLLQRQTVEVGAPVAEGSRHTDGTILYDLYSWMTLGLMGGYASEKGGDSLDRYYAGPEGRFSNVMGSRSQVTLGVQEEFGWLRGRMFYLSPQKEFTKEFRWMGRASYSQEAEADQVTDEWGAYSAFDLSLLSWLSGRIYADLRDGSGPFGIIAGLEFSGRL